MNCFNFTLSTTLALISILFIYLVYIPCSKIKRFSNEKKNISKDIKNVVLDRSSIDVTLSRPLY